MSTGRTASILRRLEGRCEKELGAVAKLIVGLLKVCALCTAWSTLVLRNRYVHVIHRST